MVSPINSYMHLKIIPCDESELRTIPGYENESCATPLEVRKFYEKHILVGYVANTFVNKTQFDTSPIRTVNDVLFYE